MLVDDGLSELLDLSSGEVVAFSFQGQGSTKVTMFGTHLCWCELCHQTWNSSHFLCGHHVAFVLPICDFQLAHLLMGLHLPHNLHWLQLIPDPQCLLFLPPLFGGCTRCPRLPFLSGLHKAATPQTWLRILINQSWLCGCVRVFLFYWREQSESNYVRKELRHQSFGGGAWSPALASWAGLTTIAHAWSCTAMARPSSCPASRWCGALSCVMVS